MQKMSKLSEMANFIKQAFREQDLKGLSLNREEAFETNFDRKINICI